MKKLLTILIVTTTIFTTSSLFNFASAQTEEGDIKIGAGLAFGSGVAAGSLDNDLGIRVDGYYTLKPEIRVGGDFTFYFPKSEGDFELTVWELNFNGNYIFLEEDGLMAYGIGGINITGFSQEFPTGSGVNSSSDSEFGLNLGAGLEYVLDFADFFAEVKLGGLGGDADQFVLGAGLRFPI
ncbi:outer membrane beta-barrel protein [Rhodohalobacter sp. 8-1]|uniref:outer membrane beta-barrel protein n=1 Tax=Rhodohalobacter sp. 8-1 TaxID=3131972 RepID=UPI0030EB78A9